MDSPLPLTHLGCVIGRVLFPGKVWPLGQNLGQHSLVGHKLASAPLVARERHVLYEPNIHRLRERERSERERGGGRGVREGEREREKER